LDTGPRELLPEGSDVQESDIVFQAKYDTRDAVGLPGRGNLLVGRYLSSGTWLGGDQSYEAAEALALMVLPLRGDALNLFAGGGMDASGELPIYRLYRIGGILSFPGMQRQQLRGDNYWLVGSNYNWRLTDIQSLFNHALYGGLRLTTGHVGGRIDGVEDDLINGLALTLGGRTPIGPFLVSLGGTDDNSWTLQLAIGRPIREGSIFDEIW
jgi:NTE family protein